MISSRSVQALAQPSDQRSSLHGLGPHDAVVSLPAVVIVAMALTPGAAGALRRVYPGPALRASPGLE